MKALRHSRITAVALSAAVLFGGLLGILPEMADAAGTPAGTAITNQASITYTDGNAVTYTSLSNTVTTTVQSVPSMTISGLAGNTVPGGQYDAGFTITNTGNGKGNIALTLGAFTGTDAASATVMGYQVQFPTGTVVGALPAGCTLTTGLTYTCTPTAGATGTATLINNATVPANGTVTLYIVTDVATTATATTIGANTIVQPVSGTITYSIANNGTTAAATSNPATPGNSVENINADARIDMTKSELAPGATGNPSTTNLQYTIYAANGGSSPANDLTSVKTLLGAPVGGVFISDKIPTFANQTPTQLTISSITAATNSGLIGTGTTSSIYYTASATGAAGTWTKYTNGALPAGTTFVGVLLSGGQNGIEIASNGNTTSGGGSGNQPTATTAAVTITISAVPPTGAGSGNTDAVVNQANSVVAGNEPNPAPLTGIANVPLNAIGPNIPVGSTDSTTTIDSGTQGILYPTQAVVPPAVTTASTQGGASNAVGGSAITTAGVLDGPLATPGATGSYNGVVAVNNNDDFTAVSFTPTGFTPTNTSATAVVGNATTATSTVTFANSYQNLGNAADNLVVSVAAPNGWGVQIYAATAAGVPTGPVLAGSTTTNTASYTFTNVPSGVATDTTNIGNYAVTYTLPAGVVAFNPYDVVNTVTSTNVPTANNTTYNVAIVGGPVALYKSQALDGTTCTGGVAVPGCIITYTINYQNNAEAASACPGTTPTTIPAFAGGLYAKGLTIAENGATLPSTWGATYTSATGTTVFNTLGLKAPATDPINAATTFPTGNTVGSYAFTALVGGSATYILAPGCSGKIVFSVTVNTL